MANDTEFGPADLFLRPASSASPRPSNTASSAQQGHHLDRDRPAPRHAHSCEISPDLRGNDSPGRGGAYLARLNSSDPLSGPPALAVPDSAASSLTLARIGPNGPNLCCSTLKPSAYGPYGVSIGFWSRIGKSRSRFAFCGRFWLMM